MKSQQVLLNDVQLNGLYSNEGKEAYNWQTLKLPPTGNVCLVASGTVVVMDEILLDNPAFNRMRNI